MSVEVANEADCELDERLLIEQAGFLLERLRIHPRAELSVVLIDEEAMAALHERWMDEAGPTDVMSFPMDELRPGSHASPPVEGMLGDVVICPQVAARQAEAAGHLLRDELNVLLTHGILHLLGYDHEEANDERLMFGLQAQLVEEWMATERSRAGDG